MTDTTATQTEPQVATATTETLTRLADARRTATAAHLTAIRDAIIEAAASVGIARLEASWNIGTEGGDTLDLDRGYLIDGTEVEVDFTEGPWSMYTSEFDTQYEAEQFSSLRTVFDKMRGTIVFQAEGEPLLAQVVNDDHEEYDAIRCLCDDIVSEEDGEPDGLMAVVPGEEPTWIDYDAIDFDRQRMDLPQHTAFLAHAACKRIVTLPEGWRS